MEGGIYIILLQAQMNEKKNAGKEEKCRFSFLYFDFYIILLFFSFLFPISSAMASNLALERFIETKEGKIKITFRSRSHVSCILVLSSNRTGETWWVYWVVYTTLPHLMPRHGTQGTQCVLHTNVYNIYHTFYKVFRANLCSKLTTVN